MNDKEYSKEKSNLENMLIPIKNAMLRDWRIKHVFHRERCSADAERMADTSALWEYRTATINWYLPSIKDNCPEQSDVFNVIVHEFTHCTLDPICQDLSDDKRAVVEFVTQSIADHLQYMFENPKMLLDHQKKNKKK